jgi:hypothetical protein
MAREVELLDFIRRYSNSLRELILHRLKWDVCLCA